MPSYVNLLILVVGVMIGAPGGRAQLAAAEPGGAGQASQPAESPSQDRYTLQEARRWTCHRHHQRAHKDGSQSAGDDQREEVVLDSTLEQEELGQYKRELSDLGQGKASQQSAPGGIAE